MWPSKEATRQRIANDLLAARHDLDLLGLPSQETIDSLSLQFVASIRREKYYEFIQLKRITPDRADPNNTMFDAERAVAFHMQQGDVDEAGWLIFLMTYFARPADTKWRRLQDVYSRLGTGVWDWNTVVSDPARFHNWMATHWRQIGGKFGNHRKYTSLNPHAANPMHRAVNDYIAWIGEAGHAAHFSKAVRAAGNNPHTIYDHLFGGMKVASFARLGKFDYLSLVGRYQLAPISAGNAYLKGATGPQRGARLLVDGLPTSATSLADLQAKLDALDARLKVGMAVMEDALCNWQKSPTLFVHYLG